MKATVPTHGAAVSRTAWIWPVALAAVIFAWSSRSRVPDVGSWIPHFDKVVHFSVYGCLGVLVCRTGRGGRWALLAALLTSLYGVSDEWHQSFVPGRSAEVADWVADTLGAIVAIGGYAGSPRLRGWLETPARFVRRARGQVEPVSTP
jgi:VanZ family protein